MTTALMTPLAAATTARGERFYRPELDVLRFFAFLRLKERFAHVQSRPV